MIAKIVLDKASHTYDKIYSYTIPNSMNVIAGMRVIVPFGNNKDRIGLVIEVCNTSKGDYKGKLKEIKALADKSPILNDEMLYLLKWLKEFTFCTYFDALKVLIPTGLGKRTDVSYKINNDIDENISKLNERELAIYNLCKKKKTNFFAGAFEEKFADSSILLDSLTEKGYLISEPIVIRKIADKTLTMIRLLPDWDSAFLTPRQREVAETLATIGECSVKELMYYTGATKSVLNNIVAQKAGEFFTKEEYRTPVFKKDNSETEELNLSDEQQQVADNLYKLYKQHTGETALIYGVTGSGKTQVFISLCKKVIAEQKQAIILVPEIALTPQTIQKFYNYFGDTIAVLHSGLSLSQRLDEWKRIDRNLVSVVVGTRSAVFAPCKNLGLIVIDEEHEHTYKSDNSPRFNAKDIARIRAKYNKCLTLFASATPSIESFYKAKNNEYHLETLTSRFGNASLPDVNIIDLQCETNRGQCISDTLCEEILYNIEHNEQSIILVNRRGHSTQITCGTCHEPILCENCSVSMKYHTANNRLVCHYCGNSIPVPKTCPKCNSEYIRFSGSGTQKVEEELQIRFPNAKILRMDTDTNMQRDSYEKNLNDFREKKYQIMVGTQMIAKGLNFPDVTLVGVVGVDSMLYSQDFRSFEKVFSLITQVIGRSGRSTKKGRAYIETYSPDNPILLSASAQDYDNFYRDEIAIRKLNLYPPFCKMVAIGITDSDEITAVNQAKAILDSIKTLLKTKYTTIPMRLLGLSQSNIFKLSGKYRYKILLKMRLDKLSRDMLWEILFEAKKKAPKTTNIFIDTSYDGSI